VVEKSRNESTSKLYEMYINVLCVQTLAKSLQQLLNYEDGDMEDMFMQTFRIGFTDIFGSSVHHDLREGGADIFVNQHNKKVTVLCPLQPS